MPSVRPSRRKPVLVASVFVVVIAAVAFLSFNDVGLAVFDFVFGNNVYAVQVSYVPSVDSFGNAKVSFTVKLVQERMPAETVFLAYGSRVDASASFDDSDFSITVYVEASTANRISVLGRTFVFGDGQARTLTCYMQHYSPGMSVSVGGFTVYDGFRTDLSGYGGQY